MAKISGIGGNFYLGGNDLSGDVGAIGGIHESIAMIEVTGIDKGAPERRQGRADGDMSFKAFYNPDEGAAHEILSAMGSADKTATYAVDTTLGRAGAAMIGKQVDYAGAMGDDGAIAFEVQVQESDGDGLRWGRMLTAGKRTDTDATDGGSVDEGAATAFGAVFYLHAFDGTIDEDATITIQDSANGTDWADVTDGSFTALDDTTVFPYAARIQLATDATVRRYLRVVTTTTGGFSSLQFAVLACRRYSEFL